MADQHAQAVEAAKRWTRGGKEFTLKHGDTMASYLLSAPAPSCDAEWCRQFVRKCRSVLIDGIVCRSETMRWANGLESLTAELAAVVAERDELREALGAICKHHSDLYDMPGYTVKHSDLGKLIDRAAALVARLDAPHDAGASQ